MTYLYIVPVQHNDKLYGPVKLMRLYEKLEPQILLEEYNEPDIKKHHAVCEWIKTELMCLSNDDDAINEYVSIISSLGFESEVNRAYSARFGVPIHMIDMPGSQSKLIEDFEHEHHN
ncbi:MAG: hypothetical protein AABW92_05070, partial [Nanoarchaeota archaeon]